MNKLTGSYIVAWDFSKSEDRGVLIVGSQLNGNMKIVNAFQGKKSS